MSLVKYRIKEVAADLGMQAKDIAAIVEQYYEKPKSTAQVLEEDQLNLIFDLLTQRNQIESVEVVFAAAFAVSEILTESVLRYVIKPVVPTPAISTPS